MNWTVVKPGDWAGLPHGGWSGVSNGRRIVALCEDVADAAAIIARHEREESAARQLRQQDAGDVTRQTNSAQRPLPKAQEQQATIPQPE